MNLNCKYGESIERKEQSQKSFITKIYKFSKLLDKQTKKKWNGLQIINILNGRLLQIHAHYKATQEISYKVYVFKFDILDEIDQFLWKENLPNLIKNK